MFELVRFQVRTRLRSTLIWGLAVGLTAALTLASFTAFDADELVQMTEAFSSDLLTAFGMTADSFATPEGYFAAQFLLLAPIALAFYPATGAARAIAGAEASGSLDVLLGTPVPRWAFPLASFVASAIGLVIIVAIYALLTWLTAVLFGIELSIGDIAISAVGLLPISLAFGGVAVLATTIVRTPGVVTAVTGGLVVVTYLMQTLVLVQPSLDWMHWITPFHYYGSPIDRGLDLSDQAVLLAAAGVLVAASIPAFARRDIRA